MMGHPSLNPCTPPVMIVEHPDGDHDDLYLFKLVLPHADSVKRPAPPPTNYAIPPRPELPTDRTCGELFAELLNDAEDVLYLAWQDMPSNSLPAELYKQRLAKFLHLLELIRRRHEALS